MQEIYIESIGKVLKNRSKLEKNLGIKISFKGKRAIIDGESEDEYIALRIIEALDLGFSFDVTLLLKDENNLLEIINIKEVTKRNDLERVRARIIGTHGKTIENLMNLTKCDIVLKDNNIGIIGDVTEVGEAIIALKSLIHGSKQGNVYARLEREKKKKKMIKYVQIRDEFSDIKKEKDKKENENT